MPREPRHWMRLMLALGLALTLSVVGTGASLAATPAVSMPTGGVRPYDLAVNPGLNRLYVSNGSTNSVTVFDTTTAVPVPLGPPIAVGQAPRGVGVNLDSNLVYVANYASNTVSVIDGAAVVPAVVATVRVGQGPMDVAVGYGPSRVYVTNLLTRTVSVIDEEPTSPTRHQVVGTISGLGFSATGLAINSSPAVRRAYVVNGNSNNVSIIDTQSGAILRTATAGGAPRIAAVNSTTGRVYVTNFSGNSVTVLNWDGSAAGTISLGLGANPFGVAVNPSTNRVYVSESGPNDVAIIDGDTNAVVDRQPVGSDPYGVATNAATGRAYTANTGSNDVSVVQD